MNDAERTPALGKAAFCCPYCNAFTSQTWFCTRARAYYKNETPVIPAADAYEKIDFPGVPPDKREDCRAKLISWRDTVRKNEPSLAPDSETPYTRLIENVFLSECFVCSRTALWMGESIAVPNPKVSVAPHADMHTAVVADFEEARLIAPHSPRGAAALLRLVIQKICRELGLPGQDLNSDIGALVSGGLSGQIQRALDTVRVIGNEAVHPGALDLRDDRQTVDALFGIVNMIVEELIAAPKRLASMYALLPPNKLEGIARRDAKIGK